MTQVKDIVDKVIKEVKNEGLYMNMVKKAASELEADGYMESLRTEGKRLSDEIFRKYFPDNNTIVDINKELREKILEEHKRHANRKELQSLIDARVKENFTYAWFEKHARNFVEDKVRREIGLAPIHAEIKQEEPDTIENETLSGIQNSSQEPSTSTEAATNVDEDDNNSEALDDSSLDEQLDVSMKEEEISEMSDG